MVPNIYALVANTSYGERQLMLVRPQDPTTWLKPDLLYTSAAQQHPWLSIHVRGDCDHISCSPDRMDHRAVQNVAPMHARLTRMTLARWVSSEA